MENTYNAFSVCRPAFEHFDKLYLTFQVEVVRRLVKEDYFRLLCERSCKKNPLELTARIDPPELPAYGRLLLDVLNGNAALSIRGDEAEECWRVVTPVLEGWARDLAPLESYAAGSDGPG